MSDTFSNFPSWWIEYSKDKTGAEWEIGSAIWVACFAAWKARAEIERLNARRFPIMGGTSIPWSLIAPHDGQAKLNHGQTLEQLAERGGLAPNELWCVVAGQKLRQLARDVDAKVWLNGWLAAHDDAVAEREIDRLRDCVSLQGSRASSAEQQLATARAEVDRLTEIEHQMKIEVLEACEEVFECSRITADAGFLCSNAPHDGVTRMANALVDRTAELLAMAAARDDACDLLDRYRGGIGTADRSRVAELRAIGKGDK